MVGYGLGIYEFRGKKIMLSPHAAGHDGTPADPHPAAVHLLITFKSMNTFHGIMFPFIVSPFAIFFFRQYRHRGPDGLRRRRTDDGLSEGGIYFRIMAPLMTPAFGAMAILGALQSWNNFLWPLIVIRTREMFTLPVGLATLLTPYGNNYDMLISGSVMATIPIIIVFFFFPRYFVAGSPPEGSRARRSEQLKRSDD